MFKTTDGKSFAHKSDAVEYILRTNESIADWYRDEHEVDDDWIDALDASNCNTYGLGAPGDLCDMILEDANVIEDE